MDNIDQYNPILYQRVKSNNPIKKYTIIGERHSGTNWIERLVNSQLEIPLTWEFGSKHFVNPDPNKLASDTDTLFIGITRNIYDWIGGFYKVPHHVHPNMLVNLECFISSEWKSEYLFEDNEYFTKKPYKNIFDLRQSKLKYLYITLPLIVDNLFITRYEDLLNNPKNIVNSLSKTFNINLLNKKYSKLILPQNKKSYKFNKKILSIIRDQTDWKTEEIFGYRCK